MDRLDDCLRFVLRWEGGYVNHPSDPGGATNKGVTQRTFDSWRLRAGKPRADVRTITDEEVHAIYAVDYWLAAKCDTLPAPLDLVVFDTAVNMGVGRAVRFLQHAVGERDDGEFGPLTREAVLAALGAQCTGTAGAGAGAGAMLLETMAGATARGAGAPGAATTGRADTEVATGAAGWAAGCTGAAGGLTAGAGAPSPPVEDATPRLQARGAPQWWFHRPIPPLVPR